MVKENPSSQIALFQPRGSSDLTGPRAGSTERGDAEIRSAAHSERSSWTAAWSQQASRRSVSPKGLPTRDRFPDTVSTVKTVERTHVSPNRDQDRPVQAHDLDSSGTGTAAIRRNMFNSP